MHDATTTFATPADALVSRYTDGLLTWLGLDGGQTFLGNTLSEYVFALGLFLVALALLKLVQMVVLAQLDRIAKHTTTDLDDTFVKMVKSFNPPFYTFLAFWIGLQPLAISGIGENLVNAVLIIWIVYQVVIAVGIFIEDVLFRKLAKDADPTTESAMRLIARLAKGALWGFGLILLLSNLGVDVTSLVAGVGIGGVAIAFALQGILSDLFASFSIYFDKPFLVGDFIIVGSDLGVVEHIGVKSTRIRALSGEELVISNQELTTARVHNYRDMPERRITFTFGILYETPAEKVKAVPGWVEAIIGGLEETRFDRAHFAKFGESSLDFEVVYYVLTDDYNRYMDLQQEINQQILEKLQAEGVGFAYPTRTLTLASHTLQDLGDAFRK
ncbi:mechanosensitive ion channel [Patescibacteria group bacterium]|jgi:small-conductance mechanosensitive channel|nr:mechanosensitive ion channel [Patescibacteria group bacterium]